MCELVKSARRKIAKEDIIVYKILFKESNTLLWAPYRSGFKYKINEMQYANIKCIRLENNTFKTCSGLHSFQNVQSAIEPSKILNKSIDYNWCPKTAMYIVYKAIIPKGTKYLLTSYNKHNVYISEQLKLIEEIETIDLACLKS